MNRYKYEGPVMSIYGQIINPKWVCETSADTKEKAQSNIKYRYKKEHGLLASAKISLPNDVVGLI